MLAKEFLTWTFGASFAIGLLAMLVFALAAKHYNKTGEVEVASGSFREPIAYMMSALGVLVPLLIAAIAYLKDEGAATNIGFLLSAAVVLSIAFAVASWLTFSLASRSTPQDTIKLKYPEDWLYKAAPGVVYIGLLVGFIYVAIHFLVLYRTPDQAAASKAAPVLIQRPAPRVGLLRSEVRDQLGEANGVSDAGNTWSYKTDRSTLKVVFDEHDRVIRVTEEQ